MVEPPDEVMEQYIPDFQKSIRMSNAWAWLNDMNCKTKALLHLYI